MTGTSEDKPRPDGPAEPAESAEPTEPAESAGDDEWEEGTARSAPPGPSFSWAGREQLGRPPPGPFFGPPSEAVGPPSPGPALASAEPWGPQPPPAPGAPPGPGFTWEAPAEGIRGPSGDLREPWFRRLGRRLGARRAAGK